MGKMSRWDEILSLPVQNPPTSEFSATELVWSKVEGWRDQQDRVAVIPFARVDDFVRGESSNKECPTRFHVEARRRRQSKGNKKVDSILEYILYWCSFGPDDHREGGSTRPSRTNYATKKTNAGRPNTKRGCKCHFIVKRLVIEPSIALIIYNDAEHVDKKGLPCHGAMFAPYISEDLRLRVLSLLHVGVSVESIIQRHTETVERQGGPCNRDDLLTHRYVRVLERKIRRSKYELDVDDAVSMSKWVENNQNCVFFYEDFSDTGPFIVGIQTEWQLQQMIRFGNHSLIASDSILGTHKLKYPVHSLLVFNQDNKAIPVAWIINPKFASCDAHKWMRALYNRVQAKDPSWKLAGFIVDDPMADVLIIRDVFQCSVLMSFWRVRHAWHKNLVKKCMDSEMRATLFRRLHQAVDNICQRRGTDDLFADFVEDFIDESDFMDYFKASWYPRLGKWTIALQSLSLASQETCAAMEFYHNQLKLRLLNEQKSSLYSRVDWLVDKLCTKVHSYFWLDEYSEKDDYARYWKDEWVSGLTSWRAALEIPDSSVVIEGDCAKVTDQLDQERVYVVWNPGSQFGICNCSWAEMGNLCEHILKVISVFKKKNSGCSAMPSISLLQYHRALLDMLHCPPRDSLIRDHAVSLVVFVQNQLNGLVKSKSSNSTMDQAASVDEDLEVMQEGGEKVFFDNCQDEHVAVGTSKTRAGTKMTIPVVCGNGRFNESCGEEMTSEMDVDPSSICISPPGLYSVDEVVSHGALSGSRQSSFSNPETEDLTNSNGFEVDTVNENREEHLRNRDPLSIGISCSTMEFVEQCTVTYPNGLPGHEIPSESVSVKSQPAETLGIIEIDGMEIERENVRDHCGNNTVSYKISTSPPMPIESQMVEAAETSSIILETDRMEIESENGSTSNQRPTTDKAFTLNGVPENMINGSQCSRTTKLVGNMMVVNSEPLVKCSSASSCSEEELRV